MTDEPQYHAYMDTLLEIYYRSDPSKKFFIADYSLKASLEKLSVKFNFELYQWEEMSGQELTNLTDGKQSLVIFSLHRENEIVEEVQTAYQDQDQRPKILRFLRDIVLRISFSLGPNFIPQKEWKINPGPVQAYVIFAVPRSGSTLLCNILKKTGLFGKPQEHLQRNIVPWLIHSDLTFSEWLEGLFQYSFTSNGYTATKLISDLFLEVRPQDANEKRKLKAHLQDKKIIFLKRMNKLRQAVSLAKAEQTGIWHKKGDKIIKSENKNPDLAIEFDLLNKKMNWLAEQEARIEQFFMDMDISPRVVFYNDLADAKTTKDTLQNLMLYLNPDFTGDLPETDYKPLNDSFTDEILRNYLEELYEKLKANDPKNPPADYLHQTLLAEYFYQQSENKRKKKGFFNFLKS